MNVQCEVALTGTPVTGFLVALSRSTCVGDSALSLAQRRLCSVILRACGVIDG